MAKTGGRLRTQALYIDAASIATMNSATLPYPGQLGQFFEKDGKMYQLVQLDTSSITGAANAAASWIDYDDFVVTTDVSDTNLNQPAGVLLGTVTTLYYCFLQVRGNATVATDGGDDIAAADVLFIDPTTDGTVDSTAAGTAPLYIPLGVANAADVDTTDLVSINLCPPLNE